MNNGTKADKKAGTGKVQFCEHDCFLSPEIIFSIRPRSTIRPYFLLIRRMDKRITRPRSIRSLLKERLSKKKDLY